MADNEFGYTTWGMDWVRLAEPINQTRPDSHLPRARSIARNGGVRATITERIVRATIHRGGQASVTYVEVAPLPRASRDAIGSLLPDPDLAPGDEAYRALVANGITPAPRLLATDCSCSARTARCVHVLAVYYDMARRIDEDPRIALSVQDYFRPTSPDVEDTASPKRRWIPIDELDPACYW